MPTFRPWFNCPSFFNNTEHTHPNHLCAAWNLGFDHHNADQKEKVELIITSNSKFNHQKSTTKQQIIIQSTKDLQRYNNHLYNIQCTMFCTISGPDPQFYNQITFNNCSHFKYPTLRSMNLLFTRKHYDIINSNDPSQVQKLLKTFNTFPNLQICDHCITQFILENDNAFFEFIATNPFNQNLINFLCLNNKQYKLNINNVMLTYMKLKWFHYVQHMCCLVVRNRTCLKYILQNPKLFLIFYGFIINSTKYFVNNRQSLICSNNLNDKYVSLIISVGHYQYHIIGASLVSVIYSYSLVDVLWLDIMKLSAGCMKNKHIKILITQIGIHKILLNYIIRQYLFQVSSWLHIIDGQTLEAYNGGLQSRIYYDFFLWIAAYVCKMFIKYRKSEHDEKCLKWKKIDGDINRIMYRIAQSDEWKNYEYIFEITGCWNTACGNVKAKYVVVRVRKETKLIIISGKFIQEICCNPLCDKKTWPWKKKFKLCASCKSVWYCCKRCQKLHWNRYRHNIHCKILSLC
eukprot:348308_1